ncbi:FAD:protein FMN transferase [candidate division KSB1 bacterium]|nr:FAD:protein FMN transferase [candidate division KSB1 bacterium]
MYLNNWFNLQLSEKISRTIHPAIIMVCLATLFLAIFPCCGKKIVSMEKTIFMMDTAVTIKVFGVRGGEPRWSEAIQAALLKISKIDSIADHYSENSLMTHINREAWKKRVSINNDMAQILQIADRLYVLSDGAFNPAIGVLTELWGFGKNAVMRVPNHDDIAAALHHVDASLVDLQNNTVAWSDSCMRLDLGGIAKGYAVDAAIQTLQQYGIGDAQVDAGGDLRALSTSLTTGRRRVYIRHPLQSDVFFGSFAMDSGAVATSGDYERYFMENGVRYHHILNGKTGYPARQCHSVTIVGNRAAECDALATAVFVLGPEPGMQLIEKLDGIEGLIIFDKNNHIDFLVSSGLVSGLMLTANFE